MSGPAGKRGKSSTQLSLVEASRRVRSGRLLARAVVEEHLAAIEDRNPPRRALVTVCATQARAAATALDDRIRQGQRVGPLAGVPFSAKDVLSTADVRTTAGHPLLAQHVPRHNAAVVQRLLDADAILLGKSNTPAFAADIQCNSVLLGQANQFNNSTLRGRFYYRSQYLGLFAQDDWKVSSKLTLNLGVRYDVEQNPREVRSQGSNFDLKAGRPFTMAELGRNFIQYTDRVNIAPRVGFAWRPLAHTVIRSHYGMFFIPLTGRATSAFSRFPADQRIGLQSDGLNPAVLLSRTPPIVPSQDGKGFALDYKIERAKLGSFQQWNFDVQHEVRGMLLQASYVGSVGHHLLMNQDMNVIRIEDVRRAGTGTQQMRPFPDYGTISCHCEFQNSSYHALQTGLERRYKGGLFWSASYTFSKFIDYNEDNFSSQFPMDPYNLSLERGLSQSHYPHRFATAAIYDLPFGKGRRWSNAGPAAWVLGGWQLSSIVSLQSGDQVWITQATNTSRMFSRSIRPNLVSNPVLAQGGTIDRWFNLDAFQPPPALTVGNSPKFPGIQGPGLANLDMSIIRFFPVPLREGMKFELRGDFFNTLNHTNLNAPSGTLGTPNFGRVTSARLPRTIQVGLKFWY